MARRDSNISDSVFYKAGSGPYISQIPAARVAGNCAASQKPGSMKVSLFVTCLVDQFYPQVGLSTVRLLEHLGVEVDFDDRQTCCGQPAFNSGYGDEARKVGRHFVDLYRDREWIVTPSGSCCSMIKVFLPELLEGDRGYAAAARQISERTRELSDFLVSVLKVESTGASFPASVTYHDSCHLLRELGIQEAPRKLLGAVSGIDLREMDTSDRCCGFGGTFSVKFPEISTAMGSNKLDAIRKTGADYVVATDVSCLMHLDGLIRREGSNLQTLHIAEVLARI